MAGRADPLNLRLIDSEDSFNLLSAAISSRPSSSLPISHLVMTSTPARDSAVSSPFPQSPKMAGVNGKAKSQFLSDRGRATEIDGSEWAVD